MDALTALTTRSTAAKLAGPGPSPHDIEAILRAAVRAPDHGRLRPWRFIVIEGDARERLGDLMAERLRAAEPDLPEPVVQKEREKPLRAPTIIVVAAKVRSDHPKIPVIEQVISAGAAAQNMLLAAHALGYGGMWKTGRPAYDPVVKEAFGLDPADQIVGFLYLGTPEGVPTSRPVELEPLVSRW